MGMSNISELISDIKRGRFVILVDAENRENEGDLVLAADFVTPEKINFMLKEARGLLCLCLPSAQIERLKLPLMNRLGDDRPDGAAFTYSIDARYGITSGVSTADRAHTIYVASRPSATSEDVVVPGHVFPLKAHSGGVCSRAGHTEGSLNLVELAGLTPASILCEILNEDGSVARGDSLKQMAKRHNIKIGTISDLICYVEEMNQRENSDVLRNSRINVVNMKANQHAVNEVIRQIDND